MRNRKKQKNIDDVSVSQLLDDFTKWEVQDSGKHTKDVDDEVYIRMMLKKDAQRQLERTKRENITQKYDKMSDPRSETLDENIRQRYFPDVIERPVEKEVPPVEKEKPPEEKEIPPEEGIVAEILDSIVVKDVSGLAAKMKEAVDFVQEEMGTSESERRLIEAIERVHETQ